MDATHQRARGTPVHSPAGNDPAGVVERSRAREADVAVVRTTVVVCADQHLVAETICAALGSRGFATELVDWRPFAEAVPRVPRPREGREGGAAGRVLLLVCDLDVPGRLGETREIGRKYGLPWLVVDALEPGPAWGALLEAGAHDVVVSSVSVDELVRTLTEVARGGSSLGELERRVMIRQWQEVKESPEHHLRVLQIVDEHDRELVLMLYEGTTVRAVAERFGLSEATVRSQVKAVLRRLAQDSTVGGGGPGGVPG